MNTILPPLTIALFAACLVARGQGTFVFDQQSSTDEFPWPNGAGTTIQQITPPYGQSFTPTLSAVDFIRLNLNDPFPTNGVGATLFINLRTDAINGPIAAQTVSVGLLDSFAGVVQFNFSNSVALTPGTVYYFQPVVQSGDPWNIAAAEYNYPGGSIYFNGLPSLGGDVWFREGILAVPEPASVGLLLLGGCVFLWRCRKRHV